MTRVSTVYDKSKITKKYSYDAWNVCRKLRLPVRFIFVAFVLRCRFVSCRFHFSDDGRPVGSCYAFEVISNDVSFNDILVLPTNQ